MTKTKQGGAWGRIATAARRVLRVGLRTDGRRVETTVTAAAIAKTAPVPMLHRASEGDLQQRVASTRERYQRLRDDPSTPQGLTARGQSGSALDYEEDAEIGQMICAVRGHRFGADGPVYRFCSRCGVRQRISTGEESMLWADASRWQKEDAGE